MSQKTEQIVKSFLESNKTETFDSLDGYWNVLSTKLNQLIKSHSVKHLHRHITTPEALTEYTNANNRNPVDAKVLKHIADMAKVAGLYNMICDAESVESFIEHIEIQLEFFDEASHQWQEDHTEKEAGDILCVVTLMSSYAECVFWAHKVGLFN